MEKINHLILTVKINLKRGNDVQVCHLTILEPSSKFFFPHTVSVKYFRRDHYLHRLNLPRKTLFNFDF